MNTNENYLLPVNVKDAKLHGDFLCDDNTVSVLRVTNIRVGHFPPVCTCLDPDGFFSETGYQHSPELYIRSIINLFKDYLEYDVQEVSWLNENDLCRRAMTENELLEERGMTFAYDQDTKDMFEIDNTRHYEFKLPTEMLLVIPVDLNNSMYGFLDLDRQARYKFIDMLAWKYMLTTLPITDIVEVANTEIVDEETAKLLEFKAFVEATMAEMFEAEKRNDDIEYDPFTVSVELNGRKFVLGPGAKEYNGLFQYIDYMMSEI